ncbi:hypothetical protein [Bosea vaviloviae]|uniref:Uncharacterized protein n=1 Tax=Bosea vaviloviae TaxID=1526658 RepID=A0A1D7U226_9HYPH|nr:hypothetical protein [Bosea vaviloviae]AOO81421.1 hypothetical protein BHK69_14005 [Bosea vaviloviae]
MRKTGLPSAVLLIAALTGYQGALPAKASEPTLEQTAELYYRTWLNFDRASALRLNKAMRLNKELRPESEGRDYIDMTMFNDPIAWQLKRMATLTVKTDPSGSELKRLMARFIVETSRRVRCTAVGSRVGSEPAGDRFHATVKLDCLVPDAVAELTQVKRSDEGADMSNPTPRLLKSVIDAYARAPLTRRIATEMDLTAGPAKERWMPSQYRTGIDLVTGSVARQIEEAGLGR